MNASGKAGEHPWLSEFSQAIIERLRTSGEKILDTDLAPISPLPYAHIIPNGTYSFDRDIAGVDPAYNTLE